MCDIMLFYSVCSVKIYQMCDECQHFAQSSVNKRMVKSGFIFISSCMTRWPWEGPFRWFNKWENRMYHGKTDVLPSHQWWGYSGVPLNSSCFVALIEITTGGVTHDLCVINFLVAMVQWLSQEKKYFVTWENHCRIASQGLLNRYLA